MKEDLRKAERDRATFLAGVSHDLRTPLARLRLGAEMIEGRSTRRSSAAWSPTWPT
jgi:two-component system osmolarity sensor histidine kinase EnvZ